MPHYKFSVPKKVKIGAYTYAVKWEKQPKVKGNDVWGYCDRDTHTIILQKGIELKRMKEVFLHECLHGIEESYGINLGERRVNTLGLALLALIDDNKLRL